MRFGFKYLAILMGLCASASAQEIKRVGECDVRPGTLCADMNLNGADLHGAKLETAIFTGATMTGCRGCPG